MQRTHYNGNLRINNVNEEVTVVGWVSRRRNLGSLVFIDLRDRSGIVQVVFDEILNETIKSVRNEYVLQVKGIVLERKDKNNKIDTGDIEIKVTEVTILNTAETPPITITDETESLEETRLKYRYLDIRRNPIKNNLILRHQVCNIIRNFLTERDFIEVETPILSNSTPEGARDYLVPSRIHKGSFYALPQAPQIYKQLLMVGGLEKYFQIARCLRDEDLRADRQPEFTQVDLEMSFVNEEDVWKLVENLMCKVFKEIKGIELDAFERLKYDDVMERYGSDKPDTRFELYLNNIAQIFTNTEFKVFSDILSKKGSIYAISLNNADKFSRKDIDRLQEYIKGFGAKALSFLKYNNSELSGSISKFMSENEKSDIIKTLNLADNDIVFIVADTNKSVAQNSIGALRLKLGKELNLIDQSKISFLWVTDFPMFEYSPEEEKYVSSHNPFTSPRIEDMDKLFSEPENCYSRAYDLVLNGYELLSGAIRIHTKEMQEKVFEAIGLSKESAIEKFGYFMEAFNYGAPPHGGVGIGLERLVMILAGTENIRDVVAFPKTSSATDLMSNSPGKVDDSQLEELGIILKK
ncbi:MAG: aspartate--tRNA ligase [Anaerorhabdus sp.]